MPEIVKRFLRDSVMAPLVRRFLWPVIYRILVWSESKNPFNNGSGFERHTHLSELDTFAALFLASSEFERNLTVYLDSTKTYLLFSTAEFDLGLRVIFTFFTSNDHLTLRTLCDDLCHANISATVREYLEKPRRVMYVVLEDPPTTQMVKDAIVVLVTKSHALPADNQFGLSLRDSVRRKEIRPLDPILSEKPRSDAG